MTSDQRPTAKSGKDPPDRLSLVIAPRSFVIGHGRFSDNPGS